MREDIKLSAEQNLPSITYFFNTKPSKQNLLILMAVHAVSCYEFTPPMVPLQ